jgi:hypothetical protein
MFFLFECETHRLKFGLTGIERSKATPGARYQYSLTRYLVLYVTLRVLINYKQASSVLAIGRTGSNFQHYRFMANCFVIRSGVLFT